MDDANGKPSPDLAVKKTDGRRSKAIDITGQTFGRWTALNVTEHRNSARQVMWLCQCSCPDKTISEVAGSALRSGQSQSCGCLQREVASATFKTHGLTGTVIYDAYKSMMARCYSEKYIDYAEYGGRGITVCQRWRDNIQNFVEDMLPSWRENTSLDRKDTDGNYCPENCRWATDEEQQNNKRNNRRITAFGKNQTAAQWSRETGVNAGTICRRLDRGWSPEDAVSPDISKDNIQL